MQTTLAAAVALEGVGAHGGLRSRLLLSPADAGSGIVFTRLAGASAPRVVDLDEDMGGAAEQADRIHRVPPLGPLSAASGGRPGRPSLVTVRKP